MKSEDTLGRWALIVIFYLTLLPGFLIFKDGIPPISVAFANHLLGMLFTILVILFTVIRLPPISSARGIEPRISAILGTFILAILVVLPRREPPEWIGIAALALILIGLLSSIFCLIWLGRAFSVMATARKLVTGGPYAVVRHPLYLSEALIVTGVVLSHFSVMASLFGLLQIAFQFRRMFNEEGILREAFPEYREYAGRVPMLIPRLSRSGR